MKNKIKNAKKLSFKKFEISKLDHHLVSGGKINHHFTQQTCNCGGASGIYEARNSCNIVPSILTI